MIWAGHRAADPGHVNSPEPSHRSLWTTARGAVQLGLPTTAYYVLRAAHVDIFLALLIGAVVSALTVALPAIRRRRTDEITVFLTVIMAGEVAVSLLAGSTQFLLARDALLTGLTGLWFIGSLWGRRPMAYLLSRPLLEGRFRWPRDWEVLWDRSPRFRRMWRVSSVMWAVGTLVDAGLRVAMAYTLPPDQVPLLGTGLYAGTSVVLIVLTSTYYAASGVYNPASALYPPLGVVQAADRQ